MPLPPCPPCERGRLSLSSVLSLGRDCAFHSFRGRGVRAVIAHAPACHCSPGKGLAVPWCCSTVCSLPTPRPRAARARACARHDSAPRSQTLCGDGGPSPRPAQPAPNSTRRSSRRTSGLPFFHFWRCGFLPARRRPNPGHTAPEARRRPARPARAHRLGDDAWRRPWALGLSSQRCPPLPLTLPLFGAPTPRMARVAPNGRAPPRPAPVRGFAAPATPCAASPGDPGACSRCSGPHPQTLTLARARAARGAGRMRARSTPARRRLWRLPARCLQQCRPERPAARAAAAARGHAVAAPRCRPSWV